MRKFATCMVAAFKACRGARAHGRSVAVVRVAPSSAPSSSSSSALARIAPRYVQRGAYLLPAAPAKRKKAAKRKAPAKRKKAAKKGPSSRPFVIYYRARKSDGLKGRKLAVEFGTSGAQALRKYFEKHPARAHEPGNHVQVALATHWRKAHGG